MIIVVAAHPDDEVIGLGAQLPYLDEAVVVHVTDGAPRDMVDAESHGFATREDYARARRREWMNALATIGNPHIQTVDLGFTDQEATNNLREVTLALIDLLKTLKPGWVITHPYEGGHPDHDSAAFASHAARRLMMRQGQCPGILIEFASYHERDGYRRDGDFLPSLSQSVLTIPLTADQRAHKRRLFECFKTQTQVLSGFPLDVERFRVAPPYDFRKAPHEGSLYYEGFPWGFTGPQWRVAATDALRDFNLC